MKRYIILIIVILFFSINMFSYSTVNAETVQDCIDEQIENINLKEIESEFDEIKFSDKDFSSFFSSLLNGEFDFDYNNILQYFIEIIFSSFSDILPLFISIIALSLFLSIFNNIKSNNEIYEIVYYVCFALIVSIISALFVQSFENCKNIMENITKICEIMTPIMTILMASSGNISSVISNSSSIIYVNVVLVIVKNFLMPILSIIFIFRVISSFSQIKLNKYCDFFGSIFKWLIGFITFFYSIFITISNLSCFSIDGISIKATKLAISNSIPIVGSLVKDGVDLFCCASSLIKSSLGLSVVLFMFIKMINTLIILSISSILFNMVSAIIQPYSDVRIYDFFTQVSKIYKNFVVLLILVYIMFFLLFLGFILCCGVI